MGCSNRTLEPNQGIYLSQAILLAVSFGVDRFFPYEIPAVDAMTWTRNTISESFTPTSRRSPATWRYPCPDESCALRDP